MKKLFKKMDKSLITQLILSVVVLVMGIIVMIFKSFGLRDLILYVAMLFYVYTFFSIAAYFVGRKEGDYEVLLTSLINVIVATFLYLFRNSEMSVILGAAMIIYTVLITCNRGYKIYTLKKNNSFMWVVKFIITFLIAFLGSLTACNLYMEQTVQTMMFGYYFICLGFLSIIETVIEIFVTEDKFKNILDKIIEEDNKLEEIKVEVKEEKVKVEEPKAVVETKKVPVKTKEVKTVKKVAKKETTAKKEAVKPVKKVVEKPKKEEVKSTSKKTTTKKETTVKKSASPKKVVKETKKKATVEKENKMPKEVKKVVKTTKTTPKKSTVKKTKSKEVK